MSSIISALKISMDRIPIQVLTENGHQIVGGAPLRDLLNYWKMVSKVYPEEVIETGVYVSSRKRGQWRQRPRANAYVPDSDSEEQKEEH